MNETNDIVATNRRHLAGWLLICCLLVFVMVVLGGVTRLTGSGLSMVDWDPIMGVVPPLNQDQWQQAFLRYQQFPEYQKKNLGMDMAGFKSIFWLEYAHRILGRSIGIVFLVPFVFFLARGKIQRPLIPKFLFMFLLGGLQGLLGWYMVKSGLVDNPHVSQYRLTAHLAMAFLIYGYMLWVAMGLLFPDPRQRGRGPEKLRSIARLVTTLIVVTVLSGGLVAGLKAGFAYNTFPLMDGHWFPEAYFAMEPKWQNPFENIAAVQFDHRLLATVVLVTVVLLWLYSRRFGLDGRVNTALHLLLGVGALQVCLGISTLLFHVPITLASAHQAGALALFSAALYLNHSLRRPRAGG